ncbi:LPXTG cell wall anchor domain-containing protein [Acetobacterium paludosum]|uniref:LPXTG cell wall anchor domain-containing protein n=1 Tax=Acetobacterium paludosum TaxID=52693 RepID=A0A923HT77_9FIRM|nr:LPXTG cell wall anchor domain-containing protein [Acetobacterium paludosum]MBC3886752.1 LPXTG cell wall anchor domain-containing protein [Acetobacterium paludosum]
MKKEIQQRALTLIQQKRKKKKTRVMLSLLSLIVILGTFYALALPALTLEKEPAGGLEELNQSDASYSPATETTAETGSSMNSDASAGSVKSADSTTPKTPAEPAESSDATAPATPVENTGSATPATPVENTGSTVPATPVENTGTAAPVTAENNTATVALTTPVESSAAVSSATTTANAVTAVTAEKSKTSSRTEYTYEENGLKVTAVLSDPAAIPDEAKLSVKRITPQNDPEHYAQYLQMLQNSLGTADNTAFSAYDICFLLNGQEIEPQAGSTVKVTIEDAAASTASAENLQVFHVVEAASKAPELQAVAAKTTDLNGESAITFTADSFSAYIVTPPVIPTGSSLKYKLIDDASDTFTQTSYYNASQLLGIAGNFHIVAFNTATLNSHTNGNILANQLKANVNFGTNNLSSELSYVQNYTTVSPTSAASNNHVLVLGSGNKVTTYDPNSFAVNGTKLDRPQNIWQDADSSTRPFIDLAQVKIQISGIASTIAQMKPVNTKSNLNSGGNSNDSYLMLTDPDKVGVYNISASDLSSYGYFGIKGFQSGHNGTVIINVDCSNAPATLSLPICEMYVGTAMQSLNEVTNFVNGRIIWNFGNYNGTITTNRMYGTVIAPNATINVNQNLNGTIIGKNVNINAESHRDDFIGRLSNGATVTVNKSWLGNDGASLKDSDLTGMAATFQLYRSSDSDGTKTAVGDPVTLNSSTGWSKSWGELPTGYTYSVVETGVTKGGVDVTGKYQTTYSADSCTDSGTFVVSNQIIYTLPNTGGAGTGLFTIAGLTLMGAALYRYRKTRPSGTSKR